jgi:alkanesulfonate monooxygenase SsuD/methylene tetrahydromethanopterin reductase-like flavin-dependent oxidoreductase (luciferase family)
LLSQAFNYCDEPEEVADLIEDLADNGKIDNHGNFFNLLDGLRENLDRLRGVAL